MQLLIRSAIQGDMSLEKVATELMPSTPRTMNEKLEVLDPRRHDGARPKGDGRSWKSHGQGHRHQRHGYVAEEDYDDWHEPEAYQSYDPVSEDTLDYEDTTNYEYESYMALLATMNARSWPCWLLMVWTSMMKSPWDYAADVIQAEMEAYYARESHQQGHQRFQRQGQEQGHQALRCLWSVVIDRATAATSAFERVAQHAGDATKLDTGVEILVAQRDLEKANLLLGPHPTRVTKVLGSRNNPKPEPCTLQFMVVMMMKIIMDTWHKGTMQYHLPAVCKMVLSRHNKHLWPLRHQRPRSATA